VLLHVDGGVGGVEGGGARASIPGAPKV
jgi:hypothetical protein